MRLPLGKLGKGTKRLMILMIECFLMKGARTRCKSHSRSPLAAALASRRKRSDKFDFASMDIHVCATATPSL